MRLPLTHYLAVQQTPEELLGIYKACLLGGCTYLEHAALLGIRAEADFRTPVADILEAYAATNPVINDGTAPGFYNQFGDQDLGVAAMDLAKTIREHVKQHGGRHLPT